MIFSSVGDRWVQYPITHEFIDDFGMRFVSCVGYIYAPSTESIYDLVRKNEMLVTK